MQSKNTILGILGLILIAVGLLLWAIITALNTYAVIPLSVGGILLLSYVAMNIQFLITKLTGRNAIEGTNMAISIAIFLAICIFLEVLMVRHSQRFDFTQVKKHSLANQTIKIIKNLKDPLIFLYLENPREPGGTEMAKDIMNLYARYNDKVKIEIVDPEREPQKVEELAPVTLGAIYVKKGERREKVVPISENNLTNAILKLVKSGEKIVYFTTGHDEPKIETTPDDEKGVAGIKDMLQEEGYKAKDLQLATQQNMPDDAATVMVVGPKKPFLASEIDTLFRYIDKGGKVLFFLDPETNSGLEKPIEERLGVIFGNNWVLENNPLTQLMGGKPYIPLMSWVDQQHPIMAAFKDQIVAMPFPIVRSVQVSPQKMEGITASELIKTGAGSWGETDIASLKSTGQAEFNEGKDIKGPVSIAVALSKKLDATAALQIKDSTAEAKGQVKDATEANVEETKQNPEARVVLFGDSDFIKGANFRQSFDLIVNSVNWTTNQEDFISIRPKDDAGQAIFMTQIKGNILFYGTLIVFPGILLLIGIAMTVWRRLRG